MDKRFFFGKASLRQRGSTAACLLCLTDGVVFGGCGIPSFKIGLNLFLKIRPCNDIGSKARTHLEAGAVGRLRPDGKPPHAVWCEDKLGTRIDVGKEGTGRLICGDMGTDRQSTIIFVEY